MLFIFLNIIIILLNIIHQLQLLALTVQWYGQNSMKLKMIKFLVETWSSSISIGICGHIGKSVRSWTKPVICSLKVAVIERENNQQSTMMIHYRTLHARTHAPTHAHTHTHTQWRLPSVDTLEKSNVPKSLTAVRSTDFPKRNSTLSNVWKPRGAKSREYQAVLKPLSVLWPKIALPEVLCENTSSRDARTSTESTKYFSKERSLIRNPTLHHMNYRLF
jgi:hypothetical protein